MRNPLFLLTVFALTARLAIAQDGKNPVVPEKVTYSRAIPKSLFAFLPRGGKSRFWGATKLKYNGQQVWIHVYDVRNAKFVSSVTNRNYQRSNGLDVFVLSKGNRLKLVSSTRFSCASYYANYETVGLETLWLDPKSHKIPIVEVDFQYTGPFGTIAESAICVFSKGVDKKAVVEQRFGEGAERSGGWINWKTEFAVMNNGLTGIIYTQGRIGRRSTYYRWKDNKFKPFRRISLNADEPEKSVEVPFDTPLEDVAE